VENKLGQVTLFVIIAIVVVGVIGLFFVFKDNFLGDTVPTTLAPVYSRYSECLSEESNNGISLLQSGGGRIDVGEVFAGNDFNPFSTHLNFLGFRIPYWYGISGNNLVINNIPALNEMEDELALFIENRLNDCDFSDFYAQGFIIEKGDVDVSVTINLDEVLVSANAPLSVSFGEDVARKTNHNLNLNNKLGSLYNSAISIYNKERDSLFLENYALDVLQSYAPVDGVEIQCSPKIWKTNEVVSEIKQGLNANIGKISFGNSKDVYFNQNMGVEQEVNILYLPEIFPSKIEVTPATQALMIAEPVGTQEGMGIMGFCYVPYHFVYDLRFPVLIQVGDGLNNFQFPVIVDIDNNVISPIAGTKIVEEQDIDVCAFSENDLTVNTYDLNLNEIDANLSYQCFDSICNLGQSENGVLETKVPACVNGYLIAEAEGYDESKVLFSSNSESFAEIVLEREYDVEVELRIGGKVISNSSSVVHFTIDDGSSSSAIIPESSTVKLKEGLYDIKAYVYGNSNVVIPASRKTECFKTNKGGISGFFGSTEERCVDVEIPSTKIDYALLGGGKLTEYYLLASELETGKIIIEVSELATPNSLEQLQYNFEVFETLGLEVSFQ